MGKKPKRGSLNIKAFWTKGNRPVIKKENNQFGFYKEDLNKFNYQQFQFISPCCRTAQNLVTYSKKAAAIEIYCGLCEAPVSRILVASKETRNGMN